MRKKGADSSAECVVTEQEEMVSSKRRGDLGWIEEIGFFTIMVARHWHRLPRYVVEAPVLGDVQGQARWGCEHLF